MHRREYITSITVADGSLETTLYCPECAGNGGVNRILYIPEEDVYACEHCFSQFGDITEIGQAYLNTLLMLGDELRSPAD